MKTAIIFMVAIGWLGLVGCSKTFQSKLGEQLPITIDSIVGVYSYIPDSVTNANTKYFESIEFKSDSSFVYKYRIGSFIKNEVKGIWKPTRNHLILNSTHVKDTLDVIECPKTVGDYFFDIKDQKGYPFNYSLIANKGRNEKWIGELNGSVSLDSIEVIKTIQVVSSSGLYSKELFIPKDNYHCYKVRVNTLRYFEDEIWRIEKNKIRPIGFNKKETSYYLYKLR